MKENLLITFFLCIFAKWIGGGNWPLTRVIQQPFHLAICWNYLNVGKMRGNPLTNEQFLEKARAIHGNKYDYSQTEYYRSHIPVRIICPEHGVFLQQPNKHLSGHGCQRCAYRYNYTEEDFVKEAKKVHGDKYDYSQANFTKVTGIVSLYCPVHGLFKQNAGNHLRGFGCPQCGHELVGSNNRMPLNEWKERSTKKHNNKYNYSLITEIKNQDSIVKIICPNHGIFMQSAAAHLNGSGCPSCKRSLGEEKIANNLDKNGIEYKQQYKIYNENLFCKNTCFEVDFFIESKNLVIEYNGIQHYQPIQLFGGEKRFKEQQERDMALRQYCKEHKIKLIEIPYTDYDNIETILKKALKIK